jgi:N-acetyl-anhydromuramoyl-L-alanine amidase
VTDLFAPDAEQEPAARFLIDIAGMCSGALYIPSPNYDERPDEAQVSLLVIHNISLPPGEFGGTGVIELFTNRLDPAAHAYYQTISELRVSAHFFIRRDGELIQFVPCELRAWHAGASQWNGRERCNDFSIGVELEGTDAAPYADAQYQCLADLTRALKRRYGQLDIVGHSDVAPGRKTDPGPAFDWKRYLAASYY